MLSSVKQEFVGRDEKRAPLKKPLWEARSSILLSELIILKIKSVS